MFRENEQLLGNGVFGMWHWICLKCDAKLIQSVCIFPEISQRQSILEPEQSILLKLLLKKFIGSKNQSLSPLENFKQKPVIYQSLIQIGVGSTNMLNYWRLIVRESLQEHGG